MSYTGQYQQIELTSGNLIRHDGPAGTVVFLVALPLCMGIALASGAPLFTGIIAGVIGGLVISVLSGSQVSVSGPAAGLAVIVANAIASLGDYRIFSLAVLLSGAMQLAMGIARLGIIGDYFPNAVIKGMLAAIGVVIVLKQIPHCLGYDKDFFGDQNFFSQGEGNTVADLFASVAAPGMGSVTITIMSLLILIFWDRIAAKLGKVPKMVPAPLVVVLAGIAANELFAYVLPVLHISASEHLVSLPVPESVRDFFAQFKFPDFNAITNPDVWTVALTLAVVASLETLLSLEAADRIDPYKRISPPSRELRAQGIGNMLSGLIGGLPITSVVVRTSANVYAGARTWMSSFIHGVLLLSTTMFIPSFLNKTPLASLAAILVVIGFKLTRPTLYKEMYRAGLDQFLPFVITVLAVVFSDLLTGVFVGFFCGIFFVIRTNHHDAITIVHQDNFYLMRFNKNASFVNKYEVRSKLRKLPEGAHVIIDGSRALYMDRDIREVIDDFRQLAPYRRITVELLYI